jgi:uncharacterized protein (DUF169 family)
MRLCEAVARSFHETLVLPAECIGCLGARRSLGLQTDDDGLVRRMMRESGISRPLVYRAVREIPRLATPVSAIRLGRLETPDVVIGYVRPDTVMRLVRRWQHVHGAGPLVRLSGFMAICGDVLVAAHILNSLRLSFGCRESRQYGDVRADRVVVGMPHLLLRLLFQEGIQRAAV